MWLVYFSGSECWFEERRRCDIPLPRGIYHLSFSRRSPGKSLNSFPLAQIDSLWGESGAESFAGSEGKPESQEDEPTALWVPREGRGLLSPPPSAGSVGGHHFKHNPSCLIKRRAAPYFFSGTVWWVAFGTVNKGKRLLSRILVKGIALGQAVSFSKAALWAETHTYALLKLVSAKCHSW